MSPTLDAFFRSWPFEPRLLIALVLSATCYLRGWLSLAKRDPGRWHSGRLCAFLGGLTAIYLALASPIEPFSGLLLQVHMVQHLLLTMAAPALIWLGAPFFPMLRGLPRSVRTNWVGPFVASPLIRSFFARLTHPKIALPLFLAATWFWHVPSLYDRALRSSNWHYLQHACFLGSALIFWYPVVRPYPSRPRWSHWLLLPYLFVADLSNTALSALLTFSGRVLYRYYTEVPRLGGLSALEDQSASGLLMWVPGSLAFLLPLFAIGVRLLSGSATPERARPIEPPPARPLPPSSAFLPILPSPQRSAPFDAFRLPIAGRFFRWRHARLALQLPLLVLAAAIIYDGLRGPQVGAMNLAGVLPWIHWRGLIVLGLLGAGNIFCMGCPFVAPRSLAKRWLGGHKTWPKPLRNKWLAVALVALFLWSYEAYSLWDRPRWTALLTLAYFVAAFLIEGLFRGSSFCKYVCPIGQFNFVQSMVSPLEIQPRDAAVCARCETFDCIRGRENQSGCELNLFVPRKRGNMDCTLCLDCLHACPHNNVGLIADGPGSTLWNDPPRSGIGRLSRRPDLAALVLLLVFGAFANAAGMTAPVARVQEWAATAIGIHSRLLMTTAAYLLALFAIPALTVTAAALASRTLGKATGNLLELVTRYAYALIPLGFGMWLAHYSFHFLTSYQTIIPVAQRFAADIGIKALGAPEWSCAHCGPGTDWLLPLEILFLDVGLLASLYAGYRVSQSMAKTFGTALRMTAPWALLMATLFATGIWIIFQPMEMRGTL